ncbi:MAG: protein kinase [archaeon]|nr:protein kinase [archaeon]
MTHSPQLQSRNSGSKLTNSALLTVDSNGIITNIDTSGCLMFGYDASELLGRPVNLLIPSPYHEQHDTYIQRYLVTRARKIIGRSRPVDALRKDGAIMPVKLHITEVRSNDSIYFVGMVTAIKPLSAEITCTSAGIILSVTGATQELWGLTNSQMISKPLSLLFNAPSPSTPSSASGSLSASGSTSSSTPPAADETLASLLRSLPADNGLIHVEALHANGEITRVALMSQALSVGIIGLYRLLIISLDDFGESVITLNPSGTILSCSYHSTVALFRKDHRELLDANITRFVTGLPDFPIQMPVLSPPSSSTSSSSSSCPDASLHDSSSSAFSPSPKRQRVVNGSHSNCPQVSSTTPSTTPSGLLPGMPLPTWPSIYGICHMLLPDLAVDSKTLHFEMFPFLNTMSGELLLALFLKSSEPSPTPDHRELPSVPGFRMMKKLGEGSSGSVFLAEDLARKMLVAIKIVLKDDHELEVARTLREIEILNSLNHPFICRLYSTHETHNLLYIVMEYVEGGDFFTYLMKHGPLPPRQARDIFLKLVQALSYCHSLKIIHRDIKHKNILIDANLSPKLIDFGLSNYTKEGDECRSTFCGTPAYAAPEMILAQKYHGPEVDVWSLGIVLYTMFSKQFPFRTVSDIIAGQYEDLPGSDPRLSDLLRRILVVDPDNRATLDDILNHPWVTATDI